MQTHINTWLHAVGATEPPAHCVDTYKHTRTLTGTHVTVITATEGQVAD